MRSFASGFLATLIPAVALLALNGGAPKATPLPSGPKVAVLPPVAAPLVVPAEAPKQKPARVDVAELIKVAVQPTAPTQPTPPPVAAPTFTLALPQEPVLYTDGWYHLRDRGGQDWYHSDPSWLKEHVWRVNTGQWQPPQTQPIYRPLYIPQTGG